MKKWLLLSCSLMLLILLLSVPGTMSAAPSQQGGADDTLQIVLVLDVSGSMGTAVYTGLVPEDLLTLLLRMDELNNDPQYLGLIDDVEEAENDPAVVEAKAAADEALEELQAWITRDQGVSFRGKRTMITSILVDAGCEGNAAQVIMTASASDKVEFHVDWDCPIGLTTPELVSEIADHVPYLDDPEYQELRDAWQAALLDYDAALETSGYNSLSQQLENYKTSGVYKQVQDEIDQLVEKYNIPSRLELAKSAANNLIDLSILYNDKIGVDSEIGLVTFSNQARFEQGLSLDYEIIKNRIAAMKPLNQTNIGEALDFGLTELENNGDPDKPRMVILLTDGHANVGLSSDEILAAIPPRANSEDITLCTAGFADLESEVDFVLLEGLAYETDGEYLFTNSGAELGAFFAACREAAAGKDLADQISGVIEGGKFFRVGTLDVDRNTCGFSLVLNYLSGEPLIEAVGPDGDPILINDPSLTYETRNQVQLFSVDEPALGEWDINLINQHPEGEQAVFSVLISTSPCDEPRELPGGDPTEELPLLLTRIATPYATRVVVGAVILLAGLTGYVIVIRQRRLR